jgi:hypothetical protein
MKMKMFRAMTAWAVMTAMGVPAVAGDLHANIARAIDGQAPAQQLSAGDRGPSIPKAYLWPGAGLFVGGMAVAINGFLNNRNGEFPEFGEAESTNVKMGAAGLAAAFGGGLLLFLGKERAGRAPSLTFSAGRIAISQRVTWR